MNRRAVIIATGLGAAAVFAGGAYLYSQSSTDVAWQLILRMQKQ
jgi:hypothetical protein